MADNQGNAVIPGSIRSTARERLLGLVDSVPGERKIMILDGWTVRVVDAVCTLHDILDSGAFLVEVLSKKRQPYPTMQALYFVSPRSESFDLIGGDFEGNRATYREAHILATGRISDDLMKRLAGSPAVGAIKTLKEVYLDYLAVESRFFSLGSDARLLHPTAPGQASTLAELDRAARQILAACVTMNELPTIRYHRTERDPLSRQLAEYVHDALLRYVEANRDYRPRRGATELVIVSRTVDLIAPVLHEFTYQAMVQDLLGAEGGPLTQSNRYAQQSAAAKTVILDEGDAMWAELRHVHIADCSEAIAERYQRFVSENKAAARQVQQRKGAEAAAAAASGSTETVSLAQLKDIMGALGEFQEMKAQFTLHMEIAERCFAAMDRKRLMEVARVEQCLACGCDAEGHSVRDAWEQVAGLLGRPELSSADRARLVMLYFVCQGVGDAERRTIIESARLDKPEQEAVRRYLLLAQGHWRPGKGDRRSRFADDDDEQYEVSRYVPQVKILLEQAALNKLDPQLFPAVAPAPTVGGSSGAGGASGATSLRARGSSATTASTTTSTAGGQRSVWMFMIGGATYSEVRSAYETARNSRVECFLGSTHLITPESFLRQDLTSSASQG